MRRRSRERSRSREREREQERQHGGFSSIEGDRRPRDARYDDRHGGYGDCDGGYDRPCRGREERQASSPAANKGSSRAGDGPPPQEPVKKPKIAPGIAAYLQIASLGRGSAGAAATTGSRPGAPAAADGAGAGRAARPNTAALDQLSAGIRRTNERLDREQFKAAEIKLRALGGGDSITDGYSTGVRPDVVPNTALPYACDRCSDSFAMATRLSDHLRAAHGVIKHASLITPSNAAKKTAGLL
ncbi:unnamed protein product [Phaeothamnion confervicola]